MNGRQIEIFHTVMKTGTVTEAANRLGITQPAVTASLKQIEAAIGFNLFHRVGGRLHPTSEARILNSEAERIQDSLTIFRKLADRLKKDLTSHLRIAAPPAFSHELIPETLAQFMEQTQDCMIGVTTQHHEQILKDMAYSVGQNNLGFTFGVDERPGIGAITVGKAKFVAIVPKNLPIAQKQEVDFSELVSHPIIGTFTGEPLGDAVENLAIAHKASIDYVIRVHNHSLAANLATKGVGSAIIDSVTASYACACYDRKNFSVVKLNDAPELPVTAVFSHEHPLNNHARLFVSLFRSCFKNITI